MALNVDADGILLPLGATVLRDNRHEIVPGQRKYQEEIPGRDGAISFGINLRSKMLEMLVGKKVSLDSSSPDYRPTIMRLFASQLNPLNGEQDLTFADEPGKVYKVRITDAIDIPRERDYIEFAISFEMLSPYILGTPQKSLVGSGTATNDGNVATPFTLTIQGPVTNPSVTVAGYTMTYTGIVGSGSVLTVDTDKLTATLDGANALPNYNGMFPKLQSGNNAVAAAAAGTTTVSWNDHWL